jgi:hypothetical protein
MRGIHRNVRWLFRDSSPDSSDSSRLTDVALTLVLGGIVDEIRPLHSSAQRNAMMSVMGILHQLTNLFRPADISRYRLSFRDKGFRAL